MQFQYRPKCPGYAARPDSPSSIAPPSNSAATQPSPASASARPARRPSDLADLAPFNLLVLTASGQR